MRSAARGRSRSCRAARESEPAACGAARNCSRCATTSRSSPVHGNVDTRLRAPGGRRLRCDRPARARDCAASGCSAGRHATSWFPRPARARSRSRRARATLGLARRSRRCAIGATECALTAERALVVAPRRRLPHAARRARRPAGGRPAGAARVRRHRRRQRMDPRRARPVRPTIRRARAQLVAERLLSCGAGAMLG